MGRIQKLTLFEEIRNGCSEGASVDQTNREISEKNYASLEPPEN